jgi:hypothetical protein
LSFNPVYLTVLNGIFNHFTQSVSSILMLWLTPLPLHHQKSSFDYLPPKWWRHIWTAPYVVRPQWETGITVLYSKCHLFRDVNQHFAHIVWTESKIAYPSKFSEFIFEIIHDKAKAQKSNSNCVKLLEPKILWFVTFLCHFCTHYNFFLYVVTVLMPAIISIS